MFRKLRCAPALAVLSIVLAGCQSTAPLAPPPPGAPAAAAAPARASAAQPVPVGFRLALDQTAPGLSALDIGQRTLWVLPQPVLQRNDLAGVAPVQDEAGRAYVRFNFTPAGAQRLAQLSQVNRGASLVISVGDTVVAAPRIGDPITQGVLNLPVADTRTAQTIVQAIAGTAR